MKERMLDAFLAFSTDKSQVYFNPSKHASQDSLAFDKNDIDKWLAKNGAAEFFLFDSAIASAFFTKDNNLLEQKKQGENIVIAEKRDATLSVYLSEDKMQAYLLFKGAYGGNDIQGEEILSSLKIAGVVRGIKKKALQDTYAKAIKLKAGEELKAAVAFGKLPIDGENGRLNYFVQDSKSRVLRPQERGDGTVDMRDLGKLLLIKEGQPLAKLIPPKLGIDGFTVTGDILGSESGEPLSIQAYAGSYIDEKDADLLVAQIPGIVTLYKDGVAVDNALCLDAVSVATGHVNFIGSVIITNDIEAGMKLEVTGSVTVGGSVESASIVCGGDVVVHNGILGRQPEEDEELSCSIKSKGEVVAKFAQYSQIYAEGNISITHNASYCHTFTKNNLIVCDDKAQNGILNGGHHIAYGKVEVVTMGTTSESLTQVEACAIVQELQLENQRYHQQFNRALSKLQHIKQLGLKMLSLPNEKCPSTLASKLSVAKTKHLKKIKTLSRQIKRNQLTIAEHLNHSDIRIIKDCYSGLHCKFDDLQRYVTEHNYHCRFYSNRIKIRCQSLSLEATESLSLNEKATTD